MLAKDKDTLVLIVKIALALQACQVKVKRLKQVLTALEVIPRKKAATLVNLKKAPALEIQTPIHHVASAVVNK